MADWQDQAACVTIPTEMFFNEGHYGNGNDHESIMVKKFCNECPVKDECLAAAFHYERNMGKDDRAGIWGGLGPRQRWIAWKKIVAQKDVRHCRNGHEMTESNTYFNPAGYTQCRACKDRQRETWKMRNRQKQLSH